MSLLATPAADLMSIVRSAHRNSLGIFMYMKDVFDWLLVGETNYNGLRPDG